MEKKSKKLSLKAILISIAVGIWVIVFQNAGIIPTTQNVKVVNRVDTYIEGGQIDADVNLEAINGNRNAFYDFNGNRNYVRIPVYTEY